MQTPRSFDALQRRLASERQALVDHPLYARLGSLADVHRFMELHVFAVWDFMSLLKSLQRAFTCIDVPWVPRGDATARRLVNEMVVGEESDDAPGGGYTSHFELYRAAMLVAGADVACIDAFVSAVGRKTPVSAALQAARVPEPARRFVEGTFATIESRSIARIAAAFTIGREDVIPDMFRALVVDLSQRSGARLELFVDYFERHIDIDGGRHGPMSARLLESLCGGDEALWSEALIGARESLFARRIFWDGVLTEITGKQVTALRV